MTGAAKTEGNTMRLAIFWDHICRAAQQQGLPVAEMAKRVRALGYSLAELDLADLRAHPWIVEILREAGMGISSIYGFFDFGRDGDGDAAQELVDAAVRTGAQRIMLIPGFYTQMHPAVMQKERANMARAVVRACDLASEKGLLVTIEDFDAADSPIRDSEGMLWFLERVPKLYATYDSGNFRFCGEDEMAAFDALCVHIAHVHLKDRALSTPPAGKPKQAMDGTQLYPCAVGSGIVPMEAVFDRLKGIGYDGVLTVEHFDSADQWANMRSSAEYIRAHFAIESES